jgi:hypothetical protein
MGGGGYLLFDRAEIFFVGRGVSTWNDEREIYIYGRKVWA